MATHVFFLYFLLWVAAKKNNNFMDMKNLLFMLFISVAVQLSAQKIYVDKVEEDGTRLISTTIDNSGFRGTYVGLNSSKISNPDTTIYNLFLRVSSLSPQTISKGRRLLLKLSNDSIITLKNGTEIKAYDNTHETIGSTKIYYAYPSYPITEEQISEICKNEVTKIRIEYETNEITLGLEEPKKKKKNNTKITFSTIIAEAYVNITAAYKKEKNIYTNF